MKKGIDVSHHNIISNWENIKNNVDFCIIRAGYGKVATQKDKQFEENFKQCKIHNIPVGAYWYSYATDTKQALEEAKTCYNIIKDKSFEFPIFYDVEDTTQLGKNCTDIINTFCNYLYDKGIKKVGWYSFESFIKSNINVDKISKKFYKWYANCVNTSDSVCINDTSMLIHQYSFKGKIDGNNTSFDLNKMTDEKFNMIMNTEKQETNYNDIIEYIKNHNVTAYDALKILQAVTGKEEN